MEYGHCARCGGKKIFKSVAGTLYFLVVQNPRSVLSEVERNKILFAMADGKYVKPEETRVTTSKTKAERSEQKEKARNSDCRPWPAERKVRGESARACSDSSS